MTERSGSETISTGLQSIAKLAREAPDMVLDTLAHHINYGHLATAYQLTRRDGACGVDGVTADQYEENLEGNLRSLLERFKSGTYRAPPVRRVHIPKGDGRTRPIGIPTFEDKVLQRAVTMVLEAVYEQDFLDCSYGFRPGRSPHQALQALWDATMEMGGGHVIDADIKSFFDTLSHSHLRSFLDQRVRDGVIRRAIDKWLKAGVMEDGQLHHGKQGTPQGGVISPLLSNLYLHEVLDKWFETEVKPRLHGRGKLIRFADDFVIVLKKESDARRVLAVLGKRLGKYGLTLHPEKTRLVEFRPPGQSEGRNRGKSFDFLGFTHHWGRSRRGNWVVKRKTAKDRLARAIKRISEWLRRVRSRPVLLQHLLLVPKLRGHYAYYGITGNARALSHFLCLVQRAWRYWLSRRSQRGHMSWVKFKHLLDRYPLPPPRVVHSVYRTAKP